MAEWAEEEEGKKTLLIHIIIYTQRFVSFAVFTICSK